MKISILMPVYNELQTIEDVLELVKNINIDKEIVLVDDCSTDGTREFLRNNYGSGQEEVKVVYHEVNKGKGAAIRTALDYASGDYIVVQDADMEYSPKDIEKLVKTAEETGEVAVYGSRFLDSRKSTSLPHFAVNKFLTVLSNILFGGNLTDMETCYKLVRTDVMRELDIKARKFDFEPEVTAKLLKKGYKIKEIPVSYRGRSYDEGKKIGWHDGVEAVIALVKHRLGD